MTVECDPLSSEVIHGDNHGIYKRMRDESPVYYLKKWDAWALFRFEDVWWACEGKFVSSASGATTAHLLTKVQPVLPLLNNWIRPSTARCGRVSGNISCRLEYVHSSQRFARWSNRCSCLSRMAARMSSSRDSLSHSR